MRERGGVRRSSDRVSLVSLGVVVLRLDPQDGQLAARVAAAPLVESTPDEDEAFEEGLAEIRAGRTMTAADVRARLRQSDDE